MDRTAAYIIPTPRKGNWVLAVLSDTHHLIICKGTTLCALFRCLQRNAVNSEQFGNRAMDSSLARCSVQTKVRVRNPERVGRTKPRVSEAKPWVTVRQMIPPTLKESKPGEL